MIRRTSAAVFRIGFTQGGAGLRPLLLLAMMSTSCCGSTTGSAGPVVPAGDSLLHPGERHFANIIQLTRDAGENAEAYWSTDGLELTFQTTRPPYQCDQIMRMPADGSGPAQLVSSGKGRTTCAYFTPARDRVVYSSTHLAGDACPPPPDMSAGYVWAIYDTYDIFSAKPDGSDLRQMTDSPGYDAEATICPVDGSIIFTSTRDGDLDLYRMDASGDNVVRLTDTPGYDGGAFFSPDCSQIVWRASRPEGKDLEEYQALLARGLVRPSRLEIFVADADGSNARQVTYLGAGTFAPYFHPSGRRILFSSNHGDPQGREFDIWAVDINGTNLERITYAPGFDGFPMFSPDGKRIAFSSNRNQANPGETDVYVADWIEGEVVAEGEPGAAERFLADVAWLADDAREGRGIGTPGLAEAADWIEKRFVELGVEPGAGQSFRQELEVVTGAVRGDATRLAIGSTEIAKDEFVPLGFAAQKKVTARTVFVGYGIVAPDVGIDDYKGVNVKGKIAVARRFVPKTEAFADKKLERLHGDLHTKALRAREAGAVGLIVVDLPEGDAADAAGDEPTLPALSVNRYGDVGIPAVVVKRSAGASLIKSRPQVTMAVELFQETSPAHNIVGLIRAGAGDRLPGGIVVGAHYDHIGLGDESSLSQGVSEPHNGADDNASGTAGLLEVARILTARRAELRRDVYLVAFTAEEKGTIGARHFVKSPPPGVDIKSLVAMINMDMIGRLRSNTVTVVGGASATEWPDLVAGACAVVGIRCTTGGDGYGPSDQFRFYAAEIPVLQFFTGAHSDYHKISDDTEHINAIGGARVAAAVAESTLAAAGRDQRLTLQRIADPLPRGDLRSFGASMGTIPDYAPPDGKPGMLLAGVRPGGPAEVAGVRAGDRLVAVGDTDIHSVKDLMVVLSSAKPGTQTTVVVEREGKRVKLPLTFGERPAGRP